MNAEDICDVFINCVLLAYLLHTDYTCWYASLIVFEVLSATAVVDEEYLLADWLASAFVAFMSFQDRDLLLYFAHGDLQTASY